MSDEDRETARTETRHREPFPCTDVLILLPNARTRFTFPALSATGADTRIVELSESGRDEAGRLFVDADGRRWCCKHGDWMSPMGLLLHELGADWRHYRTSPGTPPSPFLLRELDDVLLRVANAGVGRAPEKALRLRALAQATVEFMRWWAVRPQLNLNMLKSYMPQSRAKSMKDFRTLCTFWESAGGVLAYGAAPSTLPGLSAGSAHPAITLLGIGWRIAVAEDPKAELLGRLAAFLHLVAVTDQKTSWFQNDTVSPTDWTCKAALAAGTCAWTDSGCMALTPAGVQLLAEEDRAAFAGVGVGSTWRLKGRATPTRFAVTGTARCEDTGIPMVTIDNRDHGTWP